MNCGILNKFLSDTRITIVTKMENLKFKNIEPEKQSLSSTICNNFLYINIAECLYKIKLHINFRLTFPLSNIYDVLS